MTPPAGPVSAVPSLQTLERPAFMNISPPLRAQQSAQFKGETVRYSEWDHPKVSEPSLTEFLFRYRELNNWTSLIAPGDVCVDIGAHSGDTTLAMALCAFAPGKGRSIVVAAEPNRDVLPVLHANADANAAWADIRISECAVSKKDDEPLVLVDHNNENANGGLIDPSYSDAFKRAFEDLGTRRTPVIGVTLETLCTRALSNREMTNLRFIKTDCEGYDKEIIRSSKDFIRDRELIMFVEWFDLFNDGGDYNDFFAAIDELGYAMINPATLRTLEPGLKLSDLILVPRTHELALRT
jgi:FkbM family methyltransferase